jgi:hypothetical protein
LDDKEGHNLADDWKRVWTIKKAIYLHIKRDEMIATMCVRESLDDKEGHNLADDWKRV